MDRKHPHTDLIFRGADCHAWRDGDDFEDARPVDSDRCEHRVRPTHRFTAPGEWPARGHCCACGCTVQRAGIDTGWEPLPAPIQPAEFKSPLPRLVGQEFVAVEAE